MADVTYRIVIDDNSSGDSSANNQSVAKTISGESINNPVSSVFNKVNKFKKMAPVAYALKYADTAITANINRVELRRGLSTYQERLNFNYSILKQTVAMGAAFIYSAATMNVVGMVASVGAAVNMAVQYGIAQENINLERRVEDVGIGMANIRAGAGGDRLGRSNY